MESPNFTECFQSGSLKVKRMRKTSKVKRMRKTSIVKRMP